MSQPADFVSAICGDAGILSCGYDIIRVDMISDIWSAEIGSAKDSIRSWQANSK